jgi:hypothetical protein
VKGIFERFFAKPDIFQIGRDGGILLITSSVGSMVDEWNLLSSRLAYLNANLSTTTLDEQTVVSRKITLIEQACVACHISPIRKRSVQVTANQQKGVDLTSRLRKFDGESIDILKVRVAKRINADNKWLTDKFLSKHLAELNSIASGIADDARATISDSIWYLVASFYEYAIANALGKPFNIYVALNIRDLFSGARYTYYQRQDVDVQRADIEKWVSAFAELIRALFEEPEDGDKQALANFIFTASTQGVSGGISGEMAGTLAEAFYAFALEQQAPAKALIVSGA